MVLTAGVAPRQRRGSECGENFETEAVAGSFWLEAAIVCAADNARTTADSSRLAFTSR